MPLFYVPVIKTGGIKTPPAIPAPSATLMRLYSNPVADLEFINVSSERNYFP
jgi:hypothetical protein